MKTSKIRIRPFIPTLKDETKEGREPFAVLKYGNVTVELDYTLMLDLDIDNESIAMAKKTSIAIAAFKEIIREMHFVMDGKFPAHHRDNPDHVKTISHDPLHPSNDEINLEAEMVKTIYWDVKKGDDKKNGSTPWEAVKSQERVDELLNRSIDIDIKQSKTGCLVQYPGKEFTLEKTYGQ